MYNKINDISTDKLFNLSQKYDMTSEQITKVIYAYNMVEEYLTYEFLELWDQTKYHPDNPQVEMIKCCIHSELMEQFIGTNDYNGWYQNIGYNSITNLVMESKNIPITEDSILTDLETHHIFYWYKIIIKTKYS